MEYWVAALLALLLAAVILLIVGGKKYAPKRKKRPQEGAKAGREPCPLCGAPLEPLERVRSERFPGTGDRLVHIWGCPHCYPPNEHYRRLCPVCHAPLAPEAFVTGRMWDKRPKVPGRPRAHLHILGCAACRAGRPGASR